MKFQHTLCLFRLMQWERYFEQPAIWSVLGISSVSSGLANQFVARVCRAQAKPDGFNLCTWQGLIIAWFASSNAWMLTLWLVMLRMLCAQVWSRVGLRGFQIIYVFRLAVRHPNRDEGFCMQFVMCIVSKRRHVTKRLLFYHFTYAASIDSIKHSSNRRFNYEAREDSANLTKQWVQQPSNRVLQRIL